jgi:hypothetical protein
MTHRVRFNFLKYFNEYLKTIDIKQVHEGIMGYEIFDDIKKRFIKYKKELLGYKELITEYRSKNVAHVDIQSFDKIIELSELKKPILYFSTLFILLLITDTGITLFIHLAICLNLKT